MGKLINIKSQVLKNRLASSGNFVLGAWCLIAGFGAYFGMYAFRKPFNAATYEGLSMFGYDLKALLIIAQVLGYMSSKFIGVKVISELKEHQRSLYMLCFIGFSLLMLAGFAWAPLPAKPVFLFASALPLGMFWGLVFSYFEGRRYTEFFAIGLSVSAIVSSGILKTFSRILVVDFGIADFFVPLTAGLLFLPPILFFIWMLAQIPSPAAQDITERSQRIPLNKEERKKLFLKYATGFTLLIAVYVVLTMIRDFRDHYAVELMRENGYETNPQVFANSELLVGGLVLVGLAFFVRIRSHQLGFKTVLTLTGIGLLLVALSTWLLEQSFISPFTWMVLEGMGIYMGYVPFQIALYERFIAAFKEAGNVGFLMYVSDSLGYLGSVVFLLFQQWLADSLPWTKIFINMSYVGGWTGLVMIIASYLYFHQKLIKATALKPVILISLLFIPMINQSAIIGRSSIQQASEDDEITLMKAFREAASLRRSNQEEAIRKFRLTFQSYTVKRDLGHKYSEKFYDEALAISRQLRLFKEAKDLIHDRQEAYPKNDEHCDCGKCKKNHE